MSPLRGVQSGVMVSPLFQCNVSVSFYATLLAELKTASKQIDQSKESSRELVVAAEKLVVELERAGSARTIVRASREDPHRSASPLYFFYSFMFSVEDRSKGKRRSLCCYYKR